MKGNFQIIMVVIFMAAAVFGIMVFSGLIPIRTKKDKTGAQGTVILWGTDKNQDITQALEDFNKTNKTFVVKYVQKYPETFDQDLLEALAAGKGPDIFFLSNDLAYKYSNKIYVIPYVSYPLATFKNNFVRAGEVFLTTKGTLAFPMIVDPLVMYYNRNILDTNNIIYPPNTWEEIVNMVPIITKKDETNKIIKSTVALGQFSNILHAKDILSTLFMQAGNPIVSEKEGTFFSALGSLDGKYDLGQILKFYTDFTDPLKNVYSWNKAFKNSRDEFSAERLAFYFGYASELESLINKNPNQNFLATAIPQVKNTNSKLTYAKVTGIAVSSFSKNFNTAFTAASLMATGNFASAYAKATSVVPARRDLLSVKQTDAFNPVFYSSALFGSSWLDPSTEDTDNIFRKMVDNVLSNNLSPSDAIRDSDAKLNLLFFK
jgi:ABC-type glycerol-3-phosphate transport system substrate-binding protein